MSRAIPSSLLTAISQDTIQPYYAVEFMFDSGTLRLWTGYSNKDITVRGTGETSNITLVVESNLVELERASNWRYTNESHKSRQPDDLFFSYVQDIQDQQIAWGRKAT
jgi:hypothetical protein